MLNPKQQRFVDEYLIDLNATQAALRAGYSADTAYSQGQRLLKHVEVAAAIELAQEARSERTEITQDMVITELAKIGFADMRKLLKWTGNQMKMDVEASEETGEVEISVANLVTLFDSDELDDDIVGAISEISQTKDGSLKIKLHDKQAALVNIGKHLGMFTNKVEVHGKHTVTHETASLSESLEWLAQASGAASKTAH